MSAGPLAPALLPPRLPGLDPDWSRLVVTPDVDEAGRTWHVLDSGVADPDLTLLCVHGNPTWSYLWRELVAGAGPAVRVIAPDQLEMGFSERSGCIRSLADRIDDLSALTEALELAGPVVTVAHDWGGPISLGWAARHLDQVAGIVLANTAVHHPPGAPAPALIRLVGGSAAVRTRACVSTDAFVRGALSLSRPRPTAAVRNAYREPYASADRRFAIGAFVADIPLDDDHPSRRALDAVAASLDDLADVPALLLWGTRDPVFSERYLRDLMARLPHADVHRFIGAGHLVPEDADVAGAVRAWIGELVSPPAPAGQRPDPSATAAGGPVWSAIDERRDDDRLAVAEMSPSGSSSRTWRELAVDVDALAIGFAGLGVVAGDRVALLVPPGLDLTSCLYACWRIGAVVVFVDAGLGVAGMTGALRSANPQWLIGIPKALAAGRAMRWPGRRILAGGGPDAVSRSRVARALGAVAQIEELRATPSTSDQPAPPGPDDLAAVVFTSGATGPAKGVRYRHRQLQAQRDALMALYGIDGNDRLVAAFAPFALYGPAMGIPSVVPAMDVTAPATLTAAALAGAASAVEATLVFASPAAIANVAQTAAALGPDDEVAMGRVRLLLSAGAPVDPEVLRAGCDVMPNAEAHTPYGMTEVLPVADITLASIDEAGAGDGVCVGRPLDGVDVEVAPLDQLGVPSSPRTSRPGVSGEVCVSAGHGKEAYDRLWFTEWRSREPDRWHRTGDVGHFDDSGRLWIEGRLVHVLATAGGPVTPVGRERAIRSLDAVSAAAVVGVGPDGTQQGVAFVVATGGSARPALASDALAEEVRSAIDIDLAAVFVVAALPVDIRHQSKINRTRLAAWAERALAGERPGRL